MPVLGEMRVRVDDAGYKLPKNSTMTRTAQVGENVTFQANW